MDIIKDHEEVVFTYLDDDHMLQEIRVKSTPFANWAFWTFKPINTRIPILNNVRTPNFLLHHNADLLDLELNLIEPADGISITSLAKQIDSLLSTNTVRTLLIDLRNNTDGNNTLYDPIIEVIQKHPTINQQDRFFILTSHTTFSAGINFLDDLNYLTNGTFIGEPTGAGPNHYGDAQMIRLPHSGIFFFLSTRKWNGNDTSDASKTILPDIPIKYYFTDYIREHDPWMNVIDSIN